MPLWAWGLLLFFIGFWVGGALGFMLGGLLFNAVQEVDRIDEEIRRRLGI
jgi:hypothetical protein